MTILLPQTKVLLPITPEETKMRMQTILLQTLDICMNFVISKLAAETYSCDIINFQHHLTWKFHNDIFYKDCERI